MTCNLYNTSSEKNKVTKALTVVSSINTFKIKENTSIINPVILISKNTKGFTDGVLFNYVWLDLYKRYYFVTDIKTVANGIVEVSLSVDVLMSFKSQILSLNCIISRQENEYNTYLDDSLFRVYNDYRVQTKAFPKGFTNEMHYVIAVAGG